jgi:hypothetical protein
MNKYGLRGTASRPTRTTCFNSFPLNATSAGETKTSFRKNVPTNDLTKAFLSLMGEGRNVYRVLMGKPEGKDHLKNQGVDGRMGSKWTLGRLVGGVWSGFTRLRIGTVGGLL